MNDLTNKAQVRERVDMHMHTTASDGTWAPEILVDKLTENDIRIFSVTDHDSVDNVSLISDLAMKRKLKFIKGVEINSTFEAYNYHILGYDIDIFDKELLVLIDNNKKILEEVDNECIRYVESRHDNITFDKYNSYKNDPERGGWRALNFLKDNGICYDNKTFFKIFEEDNSPFDKMIFEHAEAVIKAIVKAGGIPVLAHPGAVFYSNDYKYVIDNMLKFGIKGIECYHPENSQEVTEYCIKLCEDNKLLITGGSDCHGDFLPKRRLCHPEIYLDMLNLGSLL